MSTEDHQSSLQHNVPISVVRLPPCCDSSTDSDNPQSLRHPIRHNFQKTIRTGSANSLRSAMLIFSVPAAHPVVDSEILRSNIIKTLVPRPSGKNNFLRICIRSSTSEILNVSSNNPPNKSCIPSMNSSTFAA